MPIENPTNEQLRERLRQAEESLQRSEQLAVAGRFAGAIIHEVNNPLEALSNLIYLTRMDAAHPDAVRKNMQVAESQITRLGEITRQTLSFYREQHEAATFDLVEIAESALRIHAHRLAARSIEVRKHLPSSAVVTATGGEILQVLSNFILNAIDALPEREAVLCVRIRSDQQHAHILISDNGHGIPAAMREKLFEPYVSSKKSGTGVGLWLSKRILDKHKGRIRLRSSNQSGKSGTTFRISLPIAPQPAH